jgi:hypothetical protein
MVTTVTKNGIFHDQTSGLSSFELTLLLPRRKIIEIPPNLIVILAYLAKMGFKK